MPLITKATANAEQDPTTHEWRRLIWIYPLATRLLNEVLNAAEKQYVQDSDDTAKIERIKEIRNIFFDLHNELNTSNPRE